MKRSMKSISIIALAAVMAMALALASCGYRTESASDDSTRTLGSMGAEGFITCYECHADASNPLGLDMVFGDSDASMANAIGWLSGPHANQETLDAFGNRVDQGPSNTGYPSHSDFTDATCETCHDQLADGRTIAAGGIDVIGLVDRPVTGCESCHGSGGSHYGVGEMPYVRPEASRCGQCHTASFPHSADRPGGYAIYEYYSASGHAISNNSHVYDSTVTTAVKARCAKCHTDEGAKMYVNNSPSELGSLDPIEGATPVQCRTCHDAHNPYELLEDAGTDAFGNTASAEYTTCVNCHEDAQGAEYHGTTSSHSWDGGTVGVGNFSSNRIISDTHFETAANSNVTGYILKTSSDTVCEDCHNVHAADNTINEQWAESAHGGYILSTIPTTGSLAGIANVTDAVAPAWGHYPWATDSTREACRRCHTATGFKSYMTDPAVYNSATLDYSPLVTNSMSEMLYCWACHDTAPPTVSLRDDHPMSDTIEYTIPTGRAPGDITGSNVCVSCHVGRMGGEDVKLLPLTTRYNNISAHYLSAGGTMYRTIGYEFSGQNYANAAGYMHTMAGTTMPNTGMNGPCVSCHMAGDAGHTLEASIEDGGGTITNIPSFGSSCAACHVEGETALIATLNTKKTGYEAALTALEGLIDARPEFKVCSNYPYLVAEGAACSRTNAYPTGGGSWASHDLIGAVFNYGVLGNGHEPGAFVHNSLYAKRLIYDSIDYIDDNTLNSSVAATIGVGPALTWLGGGARP